MANLLQYLLQYEIYFPIFSETIHTILKVFSQGVRIFGQNFWLGSFSGCNASSIRNKFGLLSFLIDAKVDVFLISETKTDDTFPTSQFLMSGYSNVYRLDRNDKGGGIMLFVKDNLITFPVSGFCFSEKNRDILRRIKPQETEMVDILLLQSS